MKKINLLCLFLFIFCFSEIKAQYNVLEFGAVNNGTTLCTQSIQSAIDSCHNQGGGTVYFPSGDYLSGTIILKSNVSIYLDNGATLVGSTNLEDFPSNVPELRSYTDYYTERSLIYAEKAENISISGHGTIYGQGEKYEKKSQPFKIRPYVIRMIQCKKVKIKDITLKNSPMWMQHYLVCEDLLIDGITVKNRHSNLNGDGIDIDGCSNVRISNCNINSEDDGICLKSTTHIPCKNVVVDNCVITCRGNGFKCGTESVGGFYNITFSNSVIYNTYFSGIALEIVDGGTMQNVIIDNITMDNINNPLYIRLGNRGRPIVRGEERYKPGTIRNITISNIYASNIGEYNDEYDYYPRKPDDHLIACPILGIPGHKIENVVLSNINLEFHGGGTKDLIRDPAPDNGKGYPEYRRCGPTPSSAFFCRYINNITFDQIHVKFKNKDERPLLFFEDVNGIDLFRIKSNDEMDRYLLKNSSGLVDRDK